MSNAKLKPIAEINLEEFERRLRASAAPKAGVEDPLAELTRLVDTIGFERSPTERALEAARSSAPKTELRLAPAPAPAAPAPAKAPPRVELAPPAAIELPVAPVEETAEGPQLRPSFDAEDFDSLAFEPPEPAPPLEDVVEAAPVEARAAETPPRARNWGLKVGGLIAAAAVMAGAVVVFKVGGVRHSGAPPLILASTTPTKVAPPSEETVRTANESGSLLKRDTAQPTPTPPKLVNPPEAPIDLSARPQPSPSPSVASPSPSASASAAADASPVAPSSDTPIVASASPTATPVSPVSADPSRVKTISVRPDGTLISSRYEASTPVAAAPAPSPSPSESRAAQATDGEASTPAVALPTKLSPPKSGARVVSKTETTAPADAGAGPVPVTPKAKKPRPAADAEAKTDDGDVPAVASGGYAVQLAAPHSEGEAKALIRSLSSKYANALGGTALGARKAELHGATIYRVRAGGLSKADAAAMCAKVKQAGGDCYVAKN